MARSFDGSSGSVTTGLTAHATLRSYSIYTYRVGDGEAGSGRIFDKRASGGAQTEQLIQQGAGLTNYMYRRAWTTGGDWTFARPAGGEWHQIGITYDAGSTANDPVFYVDGVSQAVTEFAAPTGSVVNNADAYMLGNRSADDRTWDGRLAEFAVWDAILTPAEMAALGQGVSPLLIRPQSLVSYVPLLGGQSPEPDWKIAGGATVSGATAATHPRVFKPSGLRLGAPTLSYPPTLKVEIAFATDPLAAVPTWTDVSQYVKGFTTKRGRPHELGRIDTGTATVALDNADRRFDPQNTSSPYSPNVLPLRKCRITLDDGLTAHRVFTGYVERWPMAWEAPGFESEMEISLVDGFEFLNAYDVETTKASLTTNLSGANNDLVFTAKGGGVEGNALSVVYHMGPVVSGHSTAPNVHFSPSETLQYKRDDGVTYAEYPPLTVIVPLNSNAGNALTTAHEIMAAVNSHHEASEYVSVSLAAGSDGSGQVTQMARTLLSGGEYVQELSGTRLGNVLDDISWPAAERSLDAGQSQVRAAGYDAKDEHAALQHVQETVAVEGSYAFMSGAGKVVFHDRHYRAKRPTSLATFGDGTGELVYEALTPSYDRDEIRNDIRVEMPNSQAGTASDATSKSRYGTRRERQSLPLTSVYEAQARADYLLYRYKDPGLRFESIRIAPLTTADLWEQVLTREIGDRITVKRRPPEHPAGGAVVISQECFIEQVQLSLQTVPTSALVCDWQLSPADKDKFWILEDSVYGVLGTTARVGY